MIDTRLTGSRCRAIKELQSRPRSIPRSSEGTIQYAFDNRGSLLIRVRWDSGVTGYVYLEDIELLEDEEPPTVNGSGGQSQIAKSYDRETNHL
jgi:hypothetical protein